MAFYGFGSCVVGTDLHDIRAWYDLVITRGWMEPKECPILIPEVMYIGFSNLQSGKLALDVVMEAAYAADALL